MSAGIAGASGRTDLISVPEWARRYALGMPSGSHRRPISVQLVVTDLDGTLADGEGCIHPRSAHAIRTLEAAAPEADRLTAAQRRRLVVLHSARSATAGGMRDARHAGQAVANTEATTTATTMPMMTGHGALNGIPARCSSGCRSKTR